MKKSTRNLILAAFGLGVASCAPKLDETLISNSAASELSIAVAKQAASICSAHFPNYANAVGAFVSNGFSETRESIVAESTDDARGRAFQSNQSAVRVWISDVDASNAVAERRRLSCIVAVPQMNPEQSYEVAALWVEEFEGQTNEEVGQGLSPLVVQAWRSRNDERLVFFAAHKTWPPLDRSGAAVRLFYYPR